MYYLCHPSLPTACQQLAVLAASEVIDSTCLDLLLPVRSMACSELTLLVLDFLRLGSSLFPHSPDTQHFELRSVLHDLCWDQYGYIYMDKSSKLFVEQTMANYGKLHQISSKINQPVVADPHHP